MAGEADEKTKAAADELVRVQKELSVLEAEVATKKARLRTLKVGPSAERCLIYNFDFWLTNMPSQILMRLERRDIFV